MNKTITIIRILILFTLGMFAMLFLFGEEQNENLLTWTLRFICDKTLAIGACFVIAKLYKRWSKIDPWFITYDKMCDEVKNKPNPSQL